MPGLEGVAISGSSDEMVDLVLQVVGGVGIGAELAPLIFALLAAQEPLGLLVRRKRRGGGAELGAHVGDHAAVHGAEAGEARAAVFDDAPRAPFRAVAA